MKTFVQLRRSFLSVAGLSVLALVLSFTGCNNAISLLPSDADLRASANALGFVDGSGSVVSSVSVPLLAGQSIEAGSVNVSVDQENLVVTYATSNGWKLEEAHLSVGVGFGSIPVNNGGNPVVGNFAYKATALGGVDSYAFTIPLANVGGADGVTLTIAAHAVVSLTKVDGSVQKETGWAAGSKISTKKGGNWATFFTVTLGTIEEEVVEETTETAFAYGGAYATSFEDIDASNRWGWTNGPLSVGSYSFDIYAGAGQSDLSKGTLVGTLSVVYDGAVANVSYNLSSGFVLEETHLYVGSAQLPVDRRGNVTVAPGQYPSQHNLAGVSSDSYVVSGLSGDVYVVAHAVVKGQF